MGPAFQLLFTPIGYPGFQYPGSKILRISMYTAPAILACAMNLLNAICIHKLFREIYAGVISVRLVSIFVWINLINIYTESTKQWSNTTIHIAIAGYESNASLLYNSIHSNVCSHKFGNVNLLFYTNSHHSSMNSI
jgi:hypothetical protein